jgi:large subunit ribosomal protein L22
LKDYIVTYAYHSLSSADRDVSSCAFFIADGMSSLSFTSSSPRWRILGNTICTIRSGTQRRHNLRHIAKHSFSRTSPRSITNTFNSCLYTNADFKFQFNVPSLCNQILRRLLSTRTEPAPLQDGAEINEPSVIQPSLVTSGDGREFAAFEIPKFQRKLKPYIVKRRLNRMRTYIGRQKDIRHSPWRMNLVCQFAAGQTVTEAIKQLTFCKKSMAPLVQKVIIRTANVADMKAGLQHSQLEVAECFATKGKPMKRLMIMGRGRAGRMEHKHSHFRLVLREIDFKLRMYLAPSLNQKKKWFLLQQQAEADFASAKAERDEISRLEKETEAFRTKEEKK